MKPAEELEIINKLLVEEEKLYQKRVKKLEEDNKKKAYQELLDDKRLGILGG